MNAFSCSCVLCSPTVWCTLIVLDGRFCRCVCLCVYVMGTAAAVVVVVMMVLKNILLDKVTIEAVKYYNRRDPFIYILQSCLASSQKKQHHTDKHSYNLNSFLPITHVLALFNDMIYYFTCADFIQTKSKLL